MRSGMDIFILTSIILGFFLLLIGAFKLSTTYKKRKVWRNPLEKRKAIRNNRYFSYFLISLGIIVILSSLFFVLIKPTQDNQKKIISLLNNIDKNTEIQNTLLKNIRIAINKGNIPIEDISEIESIKSSSEKYFYFTLIAIIVLIFLSILIYLKSEKSKVAKAAALTLTLVGSLSLFSIDKIFNIEKVFSFEKSQNNIHNNPEFSISTFEFGPFPTAKDSICDTNLVNLIISNIEKMQDDEKLQIVFSFVVGSHDYRRLLLKAEKKYRTNANLARARAVFIENKLKNRFPTIKTLSIDSSPKNIGYNLSTQELESDRMVMVYVLWKKTNRYNKQINRTP